MLSPSLAFRGRCCQVLVLLCATAALLSLLAFSPSAASAAQIFHSPGDDGTPGTSLPVGSAQSVFLYVDGGGVASLPGRACHDGAGSEICGFTLELSALSGLSFSSFVTEPSADLLVKLEASSVRINGIDSVAPGTGPQRIGELLVEAVLDGEIELSSAELIGADLGSQQLATQSLVTVPEPGRVVLLLVGVGLLSSLARLRRG